MHNCLTPTHRHLYYHVLTRPGGVRKEADVAVVVGGGGPAGSGIYLEDGASWLLAENNSFLIQET